MQIALVLGGETGLLGQALVQELQFRNLYVHTLGRNNGNIFDINFLSQKLQEISPDFVFNTIALTQVDDAEDKEEECIKVNAEFPKNLAKLLLGSHTQLIHYSTDFVFDGEKKSPYTENDTPNPQSVYGKTKCMGEKNVLEILPRQSLVLRTAWLFGLGRKNFVATILRFAKEKGSLNVVSDQKGSPTSTQDLARWSALLAEKKKTGLYHAVNSGEASWYDLAKNAVEMSSLQCAVSPIASNAWPQKAKRPSYSVLNNEKLSRDLGHTPRDWHEALAEYIENRQRKEKHVQN